MVHEPYIPWILRTLLTVNCVIIFMQMLQGVCQRNAKVVLNTYFSVHQNFYECHQSIWIPAMMKKIFWGISLMCVTITGRQAKPEGNLGNVEGNCLLLLWCWNSFWWSANCRLFYWGSKGHPTEATLPVLVGIAPYIVTATMETISWQMCFWHKIVIIDE